jgi:phage-related protein
VAFHEAIFHPAALTAIRSFPKVVKQELGETVLKIQWGATIGMPLSRPMPDVAPGASELRIRDRSGIYRAFYLRRSSTGAVIVFHAFQKKTQKTPRREMELGKKRLREVLQ